MQAVLVVEGVWTAASAIARGVRLLGTTEPDWRGWVCFRLDNSDGAAERALADWETASIPAKALAEAYTQTVHAMRMSKKARW
jgi:hypothetical protein